MKSMVFLTPLIYFEGILPMWFPCGPAFFLNMLRVNYIFVYNLNKQILFVPYMVENRPTC